jgi:hypothetical protein
MDDGCGMQLMGLAMGWIKIDLLCFFSFPIRGKFAYELFLFDFWFSLVLYAVRREAVL